jgi:hypothetical protein
MAAACSKTPVRYLYGFQLFAFAVSIKVYNSQELANLRFDAPAGEPDMTQFFRPITKGRIPLSQALLSGVMPVLHIPFQGKVISCYEYLAVFNSL